MIKEKLERLKASKKTTDLYVKPLFLLEDTEDLDIDTHRDLVDIDVYTKNCKPRETYTKLQELKFNRRYKRYLKSLVKKRKQDNYTFLIDFHIKFYHIDKYNRDELIFLLLPDYQIYGNELKKLGLMPFLMDIIKKMKDKSFYFMIMDYYEYDYEFFKMLIYNFIESNDQLSEFYSTTVLKVIHATHDKYFLGYVYFSLKKKSYIEMADLEKKIVNNLMATLCDKNNIRNDQSNAKLTINNTNLDRYLLEYCKQTVKSEIDTYNSEKDVKHAECHLTEDINCNVKLSKEDLLYNLKNVDNYNAPVEKNELIMCLEDENITVSLIKNSLIIAKNNHYDINKQLLRVINKIPNKKDVFEHILNHYITTNKNIDNEMIDILIAYKEYIDSHLRNKLHDLLSKIINKEQYNNIINKLFDNGLLEYIQIDMLDENSKYLLDGNVKDLETANLCILRYKEGRNQPIINGCVIRNKDHVIMEYIMLLLRSENVPAHLVNSVYFPYLVRLFDEGNDAVFDLLSNIINDSNCFSLAEATIRRDIGRLDILEMVFNYMKQRKLIKNDFVISDKELGLILKECKNIKMISMVLQMINNKITKYIPYITPVLIEERETCCLEVLIKKYQNIMLVYLCDFIKIGINIRCFIDFEGESLVYKLVDLGKFNVLEQYIDILHSVSAGICKAIVNTNNIDLIKKIIDKIISCRKKDKEIVNIFRMIEDDDIKNYIKENAVNSKILRDVVLSWS